MVFSLKKKKTDNALYLFRQSTLILVEAHVTVIWVRNSESCDEFCSSFGCELSYIMYTVTLFKDF